LELFLDNANIFGVLKKECLNVLAYG